MCGGYSASVVEIPPNKSVVRGKEKTKYDGRKEISGRDLRLKERNENSVQRGVASSRRTAARQGSIRPPPPAAIPVKRSYTSANPSFYPAAKCWHASRRISASERSRNIGQVCLVFLRDETRLRRQRYVFPVRQPIRSGLPIELLYIDALSNEQNTKLKSPDDFFIGYQSNRVESFIGGCCLRSHG